MFSWSYTLIFLFTDAKKINQGVWFKIANWVCKTGFKRHPSRIRTVFYGKRCHIIILKDNSSIHQFVYLLYLHAQSLAFKSGHVYIGYLIPKKYVWGG